MKVSIADHNAFRQGFNLASDYTFRQSFNLNVFLITEMGRPLNKPNVAEYKIEKELWHYFYKERKSLYIPFFYKNIIRQILY
jgi:hypothetical protein